MSRSCACRRVMDALRNDPRLRLAPLGARALWVLLVDAMANLPEPGVFKLGSRVGSMAEIALLVSAGLTEVETHIETLLETGLLVRRELDGAIAIPDAGALQRWAAARRNGSFGGRPRKGETPEQSRQRRAQGEFLMPIGGGLGCMAETQGNPEITQEPLAGASGLLTTTEEALSKSREVSPEAVAALASELAEIAELDPARSLWTGREVATWLAMGATGAMLREVIAAVAGRPGYRAQAVRGLGYFDGAVRDRLGTQRGERAAPPVDSAREAAAEEFNRLFAAWTAGGMAGPAPKLADYLREAA